MPFVYKNKKLVCDFCQTVGAKKVRCPFEGCPPTGVCSNCKEEHKQTLSKEYHITYGCQKKHEQKMEQFNNNWNRFGFREPLE